MNQAQLETAQSALSTTEPSAKVKDILLALYPQLVGRLATVLEARLKERKAGAVFPVSEPLLLMA